MKAKFTIGISFILTISLNTLSATAIADNSPVQTKDRYISANADFIKTPDGIMLPSVKKAEVNATDKTVIAEAPEGEVIHYNTSGQAYMAIAGMVGNIPVANFDTEMVYCEDGSVYWKNCITQMVPNTYIKGVKHEDRIEFKFPQCIMSYPDAENNMVDIYANRMKYTIVDESTGEGWFYVDEENNTVSLLIQPDGSLKGDVLNGEAILGMTTPDGTWYGYGNYDITMTPGLESPVEVPEGIVTETWKMISEGIGKSIEVGFDGNDVYLTSIFEEMPEAWVKGELKDGMITIPNQYIGVFELMQCGSYFRAITMEYDENVDDYMPKVQDQGMVFSYDADRKEMTNTEPEYYLSMMGGPGYLFEYYLNPTIRWQPEEFEINLPNPLILDCFNYDDYINYGVVAFNLPALTKEGYCLDANNISYRMFVDNEPYTFDPEDFMDLEESMEWLPYLMDNFDIHCEGEYHQIDHFLFDADTYGIQARYFDGTTEYLTDIVTASVAGKENIEINKEISSVTYTTLDGIVTKSPSKGLYLKTEKYSDGSSRTIKVVR